MIDLSQVTVGFGGRMVLADVTFSLQPGDFFFLTGPSGAGKTTLLRLCAGAMTPAEGEVRLFGRPLSEMTSDARAGARRRMGIVYQDTQFLDHLPLEENILLPFTVRGPVDAEMRAQAQDLMTWVGLGGHRAALPPTLSGGERQRAALARALLPAPELVLADEPTGNLDWEMSLKLLTLLIELNRLGTPVLMATHDLALIRAAKPMVNARVLRLKDGKLTQAGAAL
ncbi:cell division ATP-binding protein FtsE [Mangrovicoccus algicola]|uniref:ATP-binding cassette domain-containing protein n=1 Tax=Mangrovicoccus algicola TaxID=2771008 RepID=A0A8J6YXC6_9RHOB|nr:ATP-binding cassette domain-containing protein [Mangrovicoccus algicola]